MLCFTKYNIVCVNWIEKPPPRHWYCNCYDDLNHRQNRIRYLSHINLINIYLVVVSNISYVHPYLGK